MFVRLMMPILLDQFTGFPESQFAILTSVLFPTFQPMPLSRTRAPFSHPDWLFEIKWDGFRALLYSDNDGRAAHLSEWKHVQELPRALRDRMSRSKWQVAVP